MRSTRLTLAVTALSAMLALSACSDDDGGDEAGSNPSGDKSSASESPTIYPLDQCQAEVTVTGALKAHWEGDAQATPSGDSTLYQSSDGKKSWITATTAAGESPAHVVVTVNGTSYAAGENALSIDASGDAADVNATVQPAKGKMAKVTAAFTCDQ